MPKFTRISFQLEETLLSAFSKYAEELLMTKSKVLLQWLQNTKEIKLIKTDQHSKITQYQIRVSTRVAKELTDMANKLEISRSSLLRNLIKTNLLKIHKAPLSGDLILITKTYPQIMQYLKVAKLKNPENEIEDLLLDIRANLEIGPIDVEKISKALKRVKLLQGRQTANQSTQARIKMAEGEFIALTGNLEDGIEVLNQGKVIAYSTGDYVLLSDIYYITALGLHMAGKINEAIYNYENALEYITVQSEPYRYARIHIHMAMMSMFQLDLKKASFYLAKANRIINKTETPHYYIILKTVEAYLLYIGGKEDASIPKLAECFESFKAMQSTFGMYATLQTLAKAQLMAGNVDASKSIFEKLEKQEKLLKQPFSQSRSDFFQLLIQAKEGQKDAFLMMEKVIEMRKNYFRVDMEEYIFGSALYLYGEKTKGLKILERLSKKGSQELIKVNARKTIENGKLYPVAVM